MSEHPKAHSLSRRDFLVAGAGAGAGLFVFGLGGLGPYGEAQAQTAPPDLEILTGGFPRAFFHRVAEGDVRDEISYEEWEARYKPLGGILGKVLNEAHYYTNRNNLEFFSRFKRQNPRKMVLLHYNGTGRRATDESLTKFFSGHFLYYKGTRLRKAIGSRTQTVLHVQDTSVFRMKRYRTGVADDIAIARMGPGGKPDWDTAEHVRLLDIDRRDKTIKVRRHTYGSRASTFPRGAYLAAHVTTGPYRFNKAPQNNVPLWSYNLTTACPRDAQGRNCGEALADYLAGKFGPGGDLESFDGVLFDVFSWIIRFGDPIQQIDVNTDGRADRGIVGGENTVSKGALAFLEALRDRFDQLPEGKLILADGHIPRKSQRGFGLLNGIETEGFPDKYDIRLDHLSRGENIFSYWKLTSPSPQLNTMLFKYKLDKPERYRNTFTQPNLREDRSYEKLRLALASAVFTETAFSAAVGDLLEGGDGWNPPAVLWREGGVNVRVFDELWKGVDQEPNWLGQPIGEAVHLAAEAPDLLGGGGESWTDAFIGRFNGERMAFTRGGTEEAPNMVIRSTRSTRSLNFTLPGIRATSKDLFVTLRLRAEPLEDFPPSVARRVVVYAVPSGEGMNPVNSEFTWAGEDAFEASLYYQDVGPGTVHLRFEVEGGQPVYFERITAHSATDGRYREFEGGVVFANPSTRNFTFEVGDLFGELLGSGVTLRRLQGSPRQDPQTNNGSVLGETLTISSKDALFVVKEVRG